MDVRVVTLGRLTVFAGDQRIPSLPSQPVRCAVLVTLAMEREIARETLLGLLWPERPQDRARHALSQALYELRGPLGDDWIRAEREKLFATERLHADALEFAEAVARGERERALELYGRFLAGSRLANVRPFEEWADRAETRLSRLHREVRRAEIERLTRAGSQEAALDMARGWVELDPLEDEARHMLIELLARSGRQAEALRQYESYARLLEDEFGAEPLEETRAIVERIREGEAGTLRTELPYPDPALPTESSPGPEPAAGSRPVADLAPRWGRRWGSAAVLLVLLVVVMAVTRRTERGVTAMGDMVPLAFAGLAADEGASPDEAERLADRLTALVEMVGGVQPVAREILRPDEADWRAVPLPALVARAREGGAEFMVAGIIRGAGDSAGVLVDAYDLRSGSHVRWTGGARAGESVQEALERIALRVVSHVAAQAGHSLAPEAAFNFGTTSPVAYAHVREARRLLAAGDVDGTVAELRRAIRADSLYGLAYYRLAAAETTAPRWDYGAALAAVEDGLRHQSLMSPVWAHMLRAQRHYILRQADSAITAFQWITPDNRTLVDAWMGLAESLFHLGHVQGHPPAAARPALEHAAALDSTFPTIETHLLEVALEWGDMDAARRLLPRIRADHHSRAAWEATVRIRSGDDALVRRTLAELADGDRSTLSLLIAHFARGGRRPGLIDTLAAGLSGPDRTPGDRLRGQQYQLLARAMQGRWTDAIRSWAPAAASQSLDPWLLEAHFAGFPAGRYAEPMLATARRWLAEGRLPAYDRVIGDDARLAFRALIYDATLRGDSATVTSLLHASARGVSAARPADPLPPSIDASLQARLALLAGDTVTAISRLSRAVARPADPYTTFFPLTSMAPQRLLLAELLAGQGRTDRAAQVADSFFASPAIADGFYQRKAATLTESH